MWNTIQFENSTYQFTAENTIEPVFKNLNEWNIILPNRDVDWMFLWLLKLISSLNDSISKYKHKYYMVGNKLIIIIPPKQLCHFYRIKY